VPDAMGMRLSMEDSVGPRLAPPIRSHADVRALKDPDPERELRYVLDALASARRALASRVPLIGFSGSPWTLACYMVEGGGSKNYGNIKRMMLDDPALLGSLLERLERAVRRYCEAQIAAGAQAIQIFDTWGGILDPEHYRKFSLDPMFRIVSTMRKEGAPVIVFSRGAGHALGELASIGADVVGVDWTVDIGRAREETRGAVALQGNLDPSFLLGSPESIRREVGTILKKYGPGPGHVFNLGHGITPDVPVEHARALVRAVQEESPAYHA